jgi:hypothetical protein
MTSRGNDRIWRLLMFAPMTIRSVMCSDDAEDESSGKPLVPSQHRGYHKLRSLTWARVTSQIAAGTRDKSGWTNMWCALRSENRVSLGVGRQASDEDGGCEMAVDD